MQEDKIKNSVTGIVYTEDTRSRIWAGISQNRETDPKLRTAKNSTRKAVFGVMKAAIALACIAGVIVLVNIGNNSTYGSRISVYAKTPTGEKEQVVLSPGRRVALEQVETPDGNAYALGVNMPDNHTYHIVHFDRDKSTITVTTDSETAGNGIDPIEITADSDSQNLSYAICYYTDDGSRYMCYIYSDIQNIGNDKFEVTVTVHSDDGEAPEKKTVQFEISDDGCVAVLKD